MGNWHGSLPMRGIWWSFTDLNLGYDFYNYGVFLTFYVIPLSVYYVMYDVTTKHEDTLL